MTVFGFLKKLWSREALADGGGGCDTQGDESRMALPSELLNSGPMAYFEIGPEEPWPIIRAEGSLRLRTSNAAAEKNGSAPFRNMLKPKDIARFAGFLEGSRLGTPVSFELCLNPEPDYEVRTRIQAVPATDKKGQTRAYFLSVLDMKNIPLDIKPSIQPGSQVQSLIGKMPASLYQYRMGPDGQESFPFASRGVVPLLDVDMDELMRDGSVIWKNIIEEDMNVMKERIRCSARDMEPWSADFRIRDDNGRIRWLRGNSWPAVDDSDGSILWTGFIIDISDRKAVEEELRESRQKQERESAMLNNLVDLNPYSILILDAEGRVIRYNDSLVRIFGSGPPDDYCIFTDPLLIDSNGSRPFNELWQGQTTEFEMTPYNPSHLNPILPDRDILLRSVAFPVVSSEGERLAIVVMHEDVTERVAAEEELKRSAAMYRAIFENTGTASILIEKDTTVILVNEEWVHTTGYTREEVENRMKWTEFVWPGDLERMLSYHEQRRREETTSSTPNIYEFRLCTKSGDIRQIMLHVGMIPGTSISIASLLDVTERMIAEERFRLAFDANPTPMTISQAGGGPYVEINQAAVNFSGYTREEAVGKTIVELNIYSLETMNYLVQEFQARSCIRDMETEFRVKDGSIKYAILNSDLIYLNGKPHVLSSVMDITERKKMEQELQASESRFKSLMEQANMPILVFDREGYLLDVNQAWETLWNADKMDAIGRYNVLKDERLVGFGVMPYVERAFRGEASEFPEVHYTARKAESGRLERWLSGRGYPLKSEAGEVQGIVLIQEDITQRKKAEEELRQSEERFRNLAETTPSAIMIYQDDVFVYVNPGSYSITGYSESELLGMSFWEIIHPDQKDMIKTRGLLRQAGEMVVSNYEMAIVTKNAETRWVDFAAENIIYRGRPAVIINAFDITERREAEEELKKSAAWFSALTERSPVGVMVVDTNRIIININQAFCDVLGYKPEELTGQSSLQIHATEETFIELSGRVYSEINSGQMVRFEDQMKARDGSLIWFDISGQVIDREDPSRGVIWIGVDISERKAFQQALEESEEKYRSLVRYSSDPIFAFDRQGNYVYVNEAFARPFGLKPEEIIGRHMSLIFDESEIQERFNAVQEVFATGYPREIEVFVNDTEGKKRYFVTVIDPIIDSTGEVGSVSCISRDITARKNIEEALRTSEEKYRSLFVHTPAGVVNFDRDLIVTDCNDRFLEILESTRERIIGLDMKNLRDQAVLPVLDMAIRGEEAFYEGKYRATTSNVDKYVFLHTAPVYSADGVLNGGVGIVEDISVRREAELERDRLQHLLSNIIDSMPSILVGIDAEGRITQWNQEAWRRTGLPAEAARGRAINEVLPMIGSLKSDIDTALEQRSIRREDRLMHTENGETRFAEVIIYPLVSNGLNGAVVRLDDITEKVRLEEMMVQTEKMMSVGGMAAGMAHEINNPLGGILQGSQNILRRLSTDNMINRRVAEECGTDIKAVNEYARRRQILTFVEGIRSSGARASNIVSNMLQFSRGSSLKKEYADLAGLLERTIELAGSDYDLKKNYDFRHIEIVREYDPYLPPVLCSDVEIEQVVLNLLKNAAQAMGQHDRIPRIVVHTRREGDSAIIEVKDNGPGMDEQVRRRIFEPFFTTKEPGLGTGLGLAVSYFIVTNNHKGQIYVESTRGEGSTFVIRLPISSPEQDV